MSETRETILKTLFRKPNATISELAEAVGINAISVRHHLISLQADNLVVAEERRHGVGRPRLVYSLTERGRELYPTRYLALTNRILRELKSNSPPETIQKMFHDFGVSIAPDYTEYHGAPSVEARMKLIGAAMEAEGFEIEWEDKDGQVIITQIACPYFYIGSENNEICAIDSAFISEAFGVKAEQTACLLAGDEMCVYQVNYKKVNP